MDTPAIIIPLLHYIMLDKKSNWKIKDFFKLRGLNKIARRTIDNIARSNNFKKSITYDVRKESYVSNEYEIGILTFELKSNYIAMLYGSHTIADGKKRYKFCDNNLIVSVFPHTDKFGYFDTDKSMYLLARDKKKIIEYFNEFKNTVYLCNYLHMCNYCVPSMDDKSIYLRCPLYQNQSMYSSGRLKDMKQNMLVSDISIWYRD